MIGLVLSLQVAATQPSATLTDRLPAPACEVVVRPIDEKGGVVSLFGVCGASGVQLGSATAYRSSYNAALRSVVVVSTLSGVRRVLMLSPAADGSPFVNDITRDLTSLSGRYAEAGLTEEVDLTTFAVDGTVSVARRPVPKDLPQGVEMVAASKVAERGIAAAAPARLDLKPFTDLLGRSIGAVVAVDGRVTEQAGIAAGER